MSGKKGHSFSMDLRIYNQIVKLKVYEEDTLTDVIHRLASSITNAQSSKQRLKGKLEDQFRKIVQKAGLSEIVRAKIDALLDQSKIIIVGIDTEKHETYLADTPLRGLQESGLMSRKGTTEKIKKSLHHFEGDYPNFHMKYQSNEFPNQLGYNSQQDEQFQNAIIRTKNEVTLTPSKHQFEAKFKDLSSTQIFQKKYEDIDRKCQNFISKHIPQAQILQNKPKAAIHYEPYRPYQEKSLQRAANKQTAKQHDWRVKVTVQQQRPLQAISQNDYEKLRQPIKVNQNFHSYKISRYKSNNNILKNEISTSKQYQNKYNRQNIVPSKSFTKLNNFNEAIPLSAKKNYEGTTKVYEGTIKGYEGTTKGYEGTTKGYEGAIKSYEGTIKSYEGAIKSYEGTIKSYEGTIKSYENTKTIRNYDNGDGKPVGGSTSWKRLKGKFNYLGS